MSADQITPNWIAVDWGTTHLRAYAMRGGQMVAQAESDQGMNALAKDGFETALLALIDPWLGADRCPVLCCGMVGARQGWVEAPYRSVPCTPSGPGLAKPQASDPRLDVYVVPGLSQTRPADVMRGEETQIAGFLSLNEGWDGVLCLPGTHSKWVHVSAGEVVSFQTFMTGEMFALLADHSVLRHSAAAQSMDQPAFLDAVSDTLSKPETLAARLFRLRAADLLAGTGPEITRAQLSGLLIGAELAAARAYWLGQQVAVIAQGPLAQLYVTALEAQGAPAGQARADVMTRAGLYAAYQSLELHL